jgi:FkbM family methyltransferase
VDVGALLGQYSLTLSSLSTTCLCIEPLQKYAFLAKVLPPNCHVCTIAAGEETGEGALRTPDGNYGLSSLLDNEWIDTAGTITCQATAIRKLDEIVRDEIPFEPIGFIKIDVEGYECKVLAGATAVLRDHRPNLQIEIDPRNMDWVRGMLEKTGYTGLFFYEDRLHGISQFRPEIHQNAQYAWSPEKAGEFDLEKYVVNFFFIPRESTL